MAPANVTHEPTPVEVQIEVEELEPIVAPSGSACVLPD